MGEGKFSKKANVSLCLPEALEAAKSVTCFPLCCCQVNIFLRKFIILDGSVLNRVFIKECYSSLNFTNNFEGADKFSRQKLWFSCVFYSACTCYKVGSSLIHILVRNQLYFLWKWSIYWYVFPFCFLNDKDKLDQHIYIHTFPHCLFFSISFKPCLAAAV